MRRRQKSPTRGTWPSPTSAETSAETSADETEVENAGTITDATEAGTGAESEAGSADDTTAGETTAGAGAAAVIGGLDGTAATEQESEKGSEKEIATVEGTGDEATTRHHPGLTTKRGRKSDAAGASGSRSAENSAPSLAKPTARTGPAAAALLPAAKATAAVKMAVQTTQGMMVAASRRVR